MTMHVRAAATAAALGLGVAAPANAHDHSSTMTKAAKTQPVDIRFAAVAGETPVRCGTPIAGLGSTAQAAQLADLRFYVSDAKLICKNGSVERITLAKDSRYRYTAGTSGVTLIDLEDATGSCAKSGNGWTNAVVRGTVPKGTYTGVKFTVGVPFALNHTDIVGAPAPLAFASLGWSWQAGRKFVKIEVADPGGAEGTWASKLFTVHLGSTGCTGNPAAGETVSCKSPNRGAVRIAKFDAAKQQVAVDLQALLAGNDITVNNGGAPGCMSGPADPECGAVMGALGIDWKADGSGTGLPTGAAPSAFTVIAR